MNNLTLTVVEVSKSNCAIFAKKQPDDCCGFTRKIKQAKFFLLQSLENFMLVRVILQWERKR